MDPRQQVADESQVCAQLDEADGLACGRGGAGIVDHDVELAAREKYRRHAFSRRRSTLASGAQPRRVPTLSSKVEPRITA
jgi:hypothetical protein